MPRRNQAKPNACRRSWPLGNVGAVTALPSVPALVRWPTMIPAFSPIAKNFNGPIESLAAE